MRFRLPASVVEASKGLSRSIGFSVFVTGLVALGTTGVLLVTAIVIALVPDRSVYADPQRLFTMLASDPGQCPECPDLVSVSELHAWLSRSPPGLVKAGYFRQQSGLLIGSSDTISVAVVSPTFFGVLGSQPFLGRGLEVSNREGATAVLSFAAWRSLFQGRSSVLGTRVRILGFGAATVVGVMPAGFSYPTGARIWVTEDADADDPREEQRAWQGIVRLGQGSDPRAVSFAMAQVTQTSAHGLPVSRKPMFLRLPDASLDSQSVQLVVGFAVVGLLLLILFTTTATVVVGAKAVQRAGIDLRIRLALGASRAHLTAVNVIELAILTAVGGALGAAFAAAGMQPTQRLFEQSIGFTQTLRFDGRLYILAIACTTFVLGVLTLTCMAIERRITSDTALRVTASQVTVDRTGRAVFRSLMALQFVLAFVVAVATFVLNRSLRYINRYDFGISTQDLYVVQRNGSADDSVRLRSRTAELSRLAARLRLAPSIQSVSAFSVTPLHMAFEGNRLKESPLEFADGERESLSYRDYPLLIINGDTGFFQTMGLSIVRGRGFEARDEGGSGLVAVVNQAAAQLYWPSRDPVGSLFRYRVGDAYTPYIRVVGVTKTSIPLFSGGLALALKNPGRQWPALYIPLAQSPPSRGQSIVIRSPLQERQINTSLLKAAAELGLPDRTTIARTFLGAQQDWRQLRTLEFITALLDALIWPVAALVLCCVGGIALLLGRTRRREFGIRRALGASSRHLAWLSIGDAISMMLVADILGTIIITGVARLFRAVLVGPNPTLRLGILHGVDVANAMNWVVPGCGILLAAVLASLWATTETLRVSPLECIRTD